VYDESVSGDLSGLGSAPTLVTMAAGSNVVIGQTGKVGTTVDRDYFYFTVPTGLALTAITPQMGTGVVGGASFLAIQAGNQVTAPVGGPATALLGWSHYTPADVGHNILPAMGSSAGAIGFSGALGAGTYAVWVQETALGTVPYLMDFTLTAAVPEPSTGLSLLGGLLGLAWARRRMVAR
jgi:hypothetical protein